nr:FIG01122116: hypothetical protein [Kibdelosporangium sp. MJ126-NF4]CTQ99279.1 FIG01122116: hypothetical protein [Kibdelosporangium sp. MJ126-NF4]
MTGTAGPLAGVRVVDLSTVVMGPYAAQILGDLGADVIKIESPSDTVRVGLYRTTPGMTPLDLNVNRNKRSVALNLKHDTERERALDLIDTADVLITNMRPGALARLGMTYADIAERNPGLVYAHAQGFRSDSDRAGHAAYDETVQASSGLVDIANRALGEPVYLPTIIADKVAALTIVYSVLAALVHRDRTGQGQQVEIPMTDTLIAFNLVEHLAGHVFDPAEAPTGFPASMTKGHKAVRTKDGLACVIPYGPQNFRDFFAAAGRPDLVDDPRVNGDAIDRADYPSPAGAAGGLRTGADHGRLGRGVRQAQHPDGSRAGPGDRARGRLRPRRPPAGHGRTSHRGTGPDDRYPGAVLGHTRLDPPPRPAARPGHRGRARGTGEDPRVRRRAPQWTGE